MNIVLKSGTKWIYVGPGDGQGVRHTVTAVIGEMNTKNPEIATWSDGCYPDGSGMSWFGYYTDFIKQFKPVM